MRRVPIDVSSFRAPYDSVPFAGLGATAIETPFRMGYRPIDVHRPRLQGLGATAIEAPQWPTGRSYWSTARFRMPYAQDAIVNSTLRGLGAVQVTAPPPAALLPTRFQSYLSTGESMTNVMGTTQNALNQIPRWAWAVLAAGTGYLAYRGWKARQKKTGQSSGG